MKNPNKQRPEEKRPPGSQRVRAKDLRRVVGGIDTVPLPECSIGTWPTPERW